MKYVQYNNNSTTKIINKILDINKKSDDFTSRYSEAEILKSEKLYGYGYQSLYNFDLVNNIINNATFLNKPRNILEDIKDKSTGSIFIEVKINTGTRLYRKSLGRPDNNFIDVKNMFMN